MNELSKNQGVYYKLQDYGSLYKRIGVAITDLLFLIIIFFIIASVWPFFFSSLDLTSGVEYGWLALAFFTPAYFWTCTTIAFLYLAILKPSSIRTIGYRIAGLKIVNMRGFKPSLLQMAWRFLLLVFGPFHFIIDLFWLGGDDDRQSLRDKMAGTYVVRENSAPEGVGAFKYSNYNFFGLSFTFKEVKRT